MENEPRIRQFWPLFAMMLGVAVEKLRVNVAKRLLSQFLHSMHMLVRGRRCGVANYQA